LTDIVGRARLSRYAEDRPTACDERVLCVNGTRHIGEWYVTPYTSVCGFRFRIDRGTKISAAKVRYRRTGPPYSGRRGAVLDRGTHTPVWCVSSRTFFSSRPTYRVFPISSVPYNDYYQLRTKFGRTVRRHEPARAGPTNDRLLLGF